MEPANEDHKKNFFEMLLAIFEILESSQQIVDSVVSEEIILKNPARAHWIFKNSRSTTLLIICGS